MSELDQLRQEAEQLKNQIRVSSKQFFCTHYFFMPLMIIRNAIYSLIT